jgi:hypothetical protein
MSMFGFHLGVRVITEPKQRTKVKGQRTVKLERWMNIGEVPSNTNL